MRLADALYHQVRALIARRLGLDFPEGRRTNLEEGLLSACRVAAMATPEMYLAWLTSLPAESQEWPRLASYLTVDETYFFRDRASLAALEDHFLPSLIAARRSLGTLRLRLWSAGCATGEEPYSLAMLLDRLLPDRSHWQVTILATDINPRVLERAQLGLYRQWSFRETPTWLRERYFCPRSAGTFELEARIRRMVTFVPGNLADANALALMANAGTMDAILCRNVLMYFTPEAQRTTVAHLQRALAPGGWLVVAAAEASAALLRPLVPITFPGAILYRKELMGDDMSHGALRPRPLGEGFVSQVGDSRANAGRSPMTPPSASASPPVGPSVSDLVTMLQQARALADQGRLEPARDLCEAVLSQDRLDVAAYLLLAAIQHEQGGILEAMEALRRAIYLAPDCAPAYFLLGNFLLRQGEEQRGRRSLHTAIRLLHAVPRDAVVSSSDGLTAGRLLEMARASLEAR